MLGVGALGFRATIRTFSSTNQKNGQQQWNFCAAWMLLMTASIRPTSSTASVGLTQRWKYFAWRICQLVALRLGPCEPGHKSTAGHGSWLVDRVVQILPTSICSATQGMTSSRISHSTWWFDESPVKLSAFPFSVALLDVISIGRVAQVAKGFRSPWIFRQISSANSSTIVRWASKDGNPGPCGWMLPQSRIPRAQSPP